MNTGLIIAIIAYATSIWSPIFALGMFSLLSQARNTPALDSRTAFTALTIFQLLGQPVLAFIDASLAVATAMGSFERIRKFLAAETRVDPRINFRLSQLIGSPRLRLGAGSSIALQDLKVAQSSVKPAEELVGFRSVNAGWNEKIPWVLKNLNFSIRHSQLTVLLGPVGCGKSTCLEAMLGEVPYSEGNIYSGFREAAYCSQNPWLRNKTIMQNIIGPSPLDSQLYETVIKACALDKDLAQLQAGHNSMIGSNGVNLSGGQRSRVVREQYRLRQRSGLAADDE
jgi:ATP-binding cassette, subfamily C (CFTR/MRP), member 1